MFSGRERSNRSWVKPKEPSDPPEREETRLGAVVDPRPTDLQVAGDVVRVPEGRGRPNEHAGRGVVVRGLR
jgi:hypothetical protein